jgi:hypothetical protein
VLEWVLGRLPKSKTYGAGVNDTKRGANLWGRGEGRTDRPAVVPRAPSLRTVGIPRGGLSVWSQGGTAASVVEFLDHECSRAERVDGKQARSMEDERKGGKIERERRGWQVEDDEWCNATAKQRPSEALAGGPIPYFSRLLSNDDGPDLGQTYSPRAHKTRGPQKQVLRRLRKSQSPMGFSKVRTIHFV